MAYDDGRCRPAEADIIRDITRMIDFCHLMFSHDIAKSFGKKIRATATACLSLHFLTDTSRREAVVDLCMGCYLLSRSQAGSYCF